jgi:VanZ family protein
MRSATGLLTRGSLLRRLPGSRQWLRGGEHLPLQRRDRPGFAPGSLTVLLVSGRAYHRTVHGHIVRAWLPVLAWAAVIFAFSSVPDLGTGLGGWDLVLRKLAHAAEFAVLGVLLLRATGRAGSAFAIGVLYAISDEVHQSFVPGRLGSPIDVAIDAAGVAVGVLLWQSVRTRRLA